jgi:anti-anti-sigma factor
MKVTQSKQGTWTVLTLHGKIDHAGAEELEVMLLPLMAGGAVALDFRGVDYITSSGFRVLMHAEREQNAKKGRLLLGNMSTPVRQVFDTAGLTQYFKIVADLFSAIGASQPAPRKA